MQSQQILTRQVVDFLREREGIRLNLPNLFRCIDSKVTLKYLKSFSLGRKENRYQILVMKTQQLLKKNLLNLQKIKIFSEDFFNTITEDIIILEENQRLRRKIPQTKQQILIKNQQMSSYQVNIRTQCTFIKHKAGVLNFIQNNLKQYLQKVNNFGNQYDSVNRIQIFTSINIDDLYQDNITSQQDYVKNHGPLLQLLTKLKSNMIRLYQEIEECDPYDMPLKCVNFLANCKNLIMELEPFLLSEECVFNRMVFYVVKCQKDNLQLVASNYQRALLFCKQITSDLFKSYFLGFMFPPTYQDIKESLQSRRQQLLKLINNQELPQLKLNEQLKQEISKLQVVRLKIKEIKATIGVGKNRIMKGYLCKKECKKLNQLKQSKEEYLTLIRMISKFTNYFQMKKKVQLLENKQVEESTKIIKQIRMLEKINELRQALQDPKEQDKLTPQKRFENAFLKLQELILEVNTLKGELQTELQSHEDEKIHQFLIEYITHRVQKLQTIGNNFLELETKLLNTYLSIQAQTEKLQKQSLTAKQSIFSQLQNYLEKGLNPSLGFIVSNQDQYCEEVKSKIMELGKAEYLIKEWRKETMSPSTDKKDEEDIRFYRNNLEWLLILFQGSMDQKIFQMMMDKLNFQSQDYLERDKKVQQFITELNKYLNDLRNLLKTHPLSQIHPKIYKTIKDRIQLYQIITDVYTECLLVFTETKKKDTVCNIENKGLLLFDEGVFKYVLMVYQFRNKLRMEMEELKELMLPSRSKNYLIDQLYQPFAIRYGQFLGFKEEELLNFTLRLQHALNIELSQRKIITMFEQSLAKPYSEEYFQTVQTMCKQMSQINHENQLVSQLENEPVVVHNLNKFNQLIQPFQEYYQFAQQLNKDIQRSEDMKSTQKLQLRNQKLQQLRNVVKENWKKHHNQAKSSNTISKVESRLSKVDSKVSNLDSREYKAQEKIYKVDSRLSNSSKPISSERNLIRTFTEQRNQTQNKPTQMYNYKHDYPLNPDQD